MSGRLRTLEARIVGPIAARLAPYVSANVVSLLSLLAAVGAGVAFWLGLPVTGAILILANGFLDMLDGSIARARGTAGPGDHRRGPARLDQRESANKYFVTGISDWEIVFVRPGE